VGEEWARVGQYFIEKMSGYAAGHRRTVSEAFKCREDDSTSTAENEVVVFRPLRFELLI
jgi:hypothetical protein